MVKPRVTTRFGSWYVVACRRELYPAPSAATLDFEVLEVVLRRQALHLVGGMGVADAPNRSARPGMQADSSAKRREVKPCTVWSADGRDATGVPVRDAGSLSYSAVIESAATRDTDGTCSVLAQRVERETRQQAILGDGVPWISVISSERFPDAIVHVDSFHTEELLSRGEDPLRRAERHLGPLGRRPARRGRCWATRYA